MKRYRLTHYLLLLSALVAQNASAFCGFFVAQADTKLFNEASKVVIVRDDNRTVLTMVNDYQGDLKEFAMVVPVPTILQEEQIHVTANEIIDHLDRYTAPRLVEYHDPDPCRVLRPRLAEDSAAMPKALAGPAINANLGVTVEAEYQVGEYDILILSAEESDGLEKWLNMHNYKIPPGASKVLGSYIKQDMKFFVAKVNLDEQAKNGDKFLNPLQIAFESNKFMLPVRLGTLNANGPQELFIFCITRKGRVEPTNYRSIKLPSNMDIPVFVKKDFPTFYKAMFDHQVSKAQMKAIFTEYAWDMAWCDPCADDPLTSKELRELGVFWIDENTTRRGRGPQAQNAFVTRMHARYTAETFPEDLQFQVTSDRSNFQGRYVMRHIWKGKVDCKAGKNYVESLPARFEKEAQNLTDLTGWDIADIRKKMNLPADGAKPQDKAWWKKIWN